MRRHDGFTLLELLIVVVILGVLALIAAPTLLNASDRAKEGVVKANVSAAASTVTTRLAIEEENGATVAEIAVNQLNTAGTSDDTNDDAKSPFDSESDAFVEGTEGSKGQVALDGDTEEYAVIIKGFGKDGETVVGAKTVTAPQESIGEAEAEEENLLSE